MEREFEFQKTGNAKTGSGFVATNQNGKVSVFCVTQLSTAIPEIGALDRIVAGALEHLKGRSMDGYTGNAFATEASNQLMRLKPSLENTISTVQKKYSGHAARRIEMLSFNRDAEPNQALRSELRTWFMSHDVPNRIRLLNGADYSLAVSILEGGQTLTGTQDQIWNSFLDRAAALIHIKKTGLDNDYRLKPSEENLTALGQYQAAVMEAATGAVKAYHAEAELLKLAEAYLQSVIRALMLVTGKSFDEIVF